MASTLVSCTCNRKTKLALERMRLCDDKYTFQFVHSPEDETCSKCTPLCPYGEITPLQFANINIDQLSM